MYSRKAFSLVLTTILLSQLLTGGAALLAQPVSSAAPPPPEREIQIEMAYPDKAEPSGATAADGLFPDRWFYGETTWGRNNLVDQDLHFTIEITYQHPYIEYFASAPTPIEYNQYVTNCTHDVDNHRFNCVGVFPRSDPSQYLEGVITIAFIGTCSLYEQPRPTQVSINAQITYTEDPGTDTTSGTMDVEPVLDLSLLSQTPADGTTNVVIEDRNHQGPLLSWSPYLNHACGDGSDPFNQDVAYLVRLREQGGEWRAFEAEYPTCSKQLRLSPNDLRCDENGDPKTYEWDVAIADIRYAQCGAVAHNEIRFTTGTCRPQIDVQPKFGDYFLTGLQVENKYRVEVDWNGTAFELPNESPYGKVVFDLNGNRVEKPGLEWGAEHTYNMGDDFRASLAGGNNALRIKAVTNGGYESLEETLQPMVFPVPGWITQFALGSFEVDLQSRTVRYRRQIEYPNPHFEAQYRVPSWVPYVGGANMGIQETYVAVGAEASSDGTGAAGLQGNTGVQLTDDKQVMGSVSGRGDVRLRPRYGLDLTEATFGLDIRGEVSEEMGIADLIPALKAAENWWLVGRLVKWFNQRATVEASIGPQVQIRTRFRDIDDELTFHSGTGTGLIDMALTLTLRVLDSLQASLTGGGTPRVVIQVPASGPWGYLQEIAIRLYARAAITVWRFEEEWERGITCSLPQGRCESDEGMAKMALGEGAGWRLMGREYVTDDYAVFTANRAIRDTKSVSGLATTEEMEIVSNVFPLANPALAVRADGDRLLLWIHDDESKPVAQGEEIHAAYWNGTGWTSDTLTADNYQDFGPRVAFDADGDAVAVWERTNTVHISPTLNITYVQSFEIASAEWVSGTGTWSNVVTLTNDALLDTAPQLARGQDGALMALWRTSDGTDMLGTPAHPLTLTYATWSGGSWSGPVAALAGLTDTLDVDLAVYSATQAALVLVRDTDGDIVTVGDTELYYASYDGINWSGLSSLTSDGITDTAPALSYDGSGEPVIVWAHGDDLVMQSGWAGSPTLVRAGSTSGAFLDFDLLPDLDGNLALLWQAISEDGADVTYAVYDVSNDSWGSDNTLMDDSALEESFAPAFASDGTLYMAYNKVAMELVTETVEVSPTLTITATNIPHPVQTDLYLLSHTVGRDLAIGGGDIALSDPNPAPGSSVIVSATVHNQGDLAVSGGEVAFYDGDPGAGGTQIGLTRTLVSPFRAATSDIVTVNWDIPVGASAHVLYVVADPADDVSEGNEDNNQATLPVVQPDLAVAWTYSAYTTDTITLTAAISNAGHLSATMPFSVAFRAGDPVTGTLLGAVDVTDGLGGGAQVTVTLPLTDPIELFGLSDIVWIVADAGDAVVEADEENNVDYAALRVLPDLTVAAEDIQFGDLVTVTVHNAGVMTATDVALAAWTSSLSGTLAYSGTLGELGPGASTEVDFTCAAGCRWLWVKVDPDDVVVESDEINNLAVRLDCPKPLTSVGIDGPTMGYTDTLYAFTATVVPTDATKPVTYTWTPEPAPGNVQLPEGSVVTYTWDLPGTYTFTVRAENCGGSDVATHTITIEPPPGCPRPLTGVSIDGPATGYTDTLYAFTAAVVPTDATEPVSYTWTPTPAPGSLLLPKGSVVTYTWDLPGTYTLTVRAENCGGSEVATHTIAIGPLGHTIYLPLVLRGYEPPLAPDRYVRRYGSDSGDCSTADNACGSIQYAVDQAAEGDLIGIAGYEDAYTPENPDGSATRTYWYVEQHASPSGYGGPSQVRQAVYLDKTVTLRGGYSSDFRQWDPATYKSVLRPGPSGFGGRVVFIDAGVHPTLEWLYIIEGSAVGQGGLYLDPYEDAGNGIFAWGTLTDIIDVTIRNCVIANNTGAVSSGGGVFLVYRNNATVADNVVQGNSAYRGGGISVNSSDDVVLSGNEVVANIATGQQAGGIYVVDSDDVRLTGNRVYSNTARQSGGGIEVRFSGNPQLIGNVVHDNVAALYSYGVGGGIDLFAIFEGFTVQDNHIYNNVATQYTGQGPYDTGIGGGIYLNEVENGMVSGNVITGNLSSQYHVGTGGGLSIYSSDVILVDGNVIHSNVATLNDDSGPSSTGGGIRVSYNSMDVTLSNNVIAGNRASAGGDGIDLVGSISQPVAASLLHNTIADNGTLGGLVRRSFTPAAEDALFPGWASVAPDGPALAEVRLLADARVVSIDGSGVTTQGKAQGILVEPYATLNAVNTILSGHTLGISVAHPASSTVGVDYTLWWDNTADYASGVAHSNDLSGDPAFMDPAAWDYHIGSDSAAIDQGMGAGVTTDFEGDTRPQGAGYDVGADEYTWALQRQ